MLEAQGYVPPLSTASTEPGAGASTHTESSAAAASAAQRPTEAFSQTLQLLRSAYDSLEAQQDTEQAQASFAAEEGMLSVPFPGSTGALPTDVAQAWWLNASLSLLVTSLDHQLDPPAKTLLFNDLATGHQQRDRASRYAAALEAVLRLLPLCYNEYRKLVFALIERNDVSLTRYAGL